jgi:hypothetical protein
MTGIFINYRRDDVRGVAGRLYDHLTTTFSKDDVFMDVDAMEPGIDFVRQLDSKVSQCHVLLAMIGPNWLEARDRDGKPRLDDDKDFVRVELASALKREIHVIPVLIDGAQMPPQEKLPDDLRPLTRHHALELRHTRFSADAETIVHALQKISPKRMPWKLIAAGVGGVAVLGVAALFLNAMLRSGPATPEKLIAPQAQMAPQQAVAAAQTSPAPLSPNIAGTWSGSYYYDGNTSKPVAFSFYFDAAGNGRSEEDNTFGEKSAPKLFATLKRSASSLAASEDITITKTYDGTGGVSHAVTYIGSVSADLRSIFGRWETTNWRGNFTISR